MRSVSHGSVGVKKAAWCIFVAVVAYYHFLAGALVAIATAFCWLFERHIGTKSIPATASESVALAASAAAPPAAPPEAEWILHKEIKKWIDSRFEDEELASLGQFLGEQLEDYKAYLLRLSDVPRRANLKLIDAAKTHQTTAKLLAGVVGVISVGCTQGRSSEEIMSAASVSLRLVPNYPLFTHDLTLNALWKMCLLQLEIHGFLQELIFCQIQSAEGDSAESLFKLADSIGEAYWFGKETRAAERVAHIVAVRNAGRTRG